MPCKLQIFVINTENTASQNIHAKTGHEGPEGGKGIALLFLQPWCQLGGGVVNATPCQLYTQERDLVPLLQEVVWASGPAYNGCRKSCPLLGFDPWAFHPIASPDTDSKKISFGFSSLCTDKSILPGFKQCVCKIFLKNMFLLFN